MNTNFNTIIQADAQDREDLFRTTATRLNTSPIHIEKDFWVCWTLDNLFHGRDANAPRLLFKGGTSLSKGFDLIQRFSEDIDVTVFRPDIGHDFSNRELEALSGRKRGRLLGILKADCSTYITQTLLNDMTRLFGAPLDGQKWSIEVDSNDKDAQSLLFWYPTVFPTVSGDYIKRAVLIESGAKSALDPHMERTIRPYIADEMGIDLEIAGVTSVDPKRTFWDKIIVVHGQRQWFERNGELKGKGHRLTRHYYDLHQLMQSPISQEALDDEEMGRDVNLHARMFFHRAPYGLELAKPGSFTLTPTSEMLPQLKADYMEMASMIFGDVPPFQDIIDTITEIENSLNQELTPSPF